MKIVINNCFGGFGLSDKALLMLKDMGWEVEKFDGAFTFSNEYYLKDERSHSDLFRSNNDLIHVVEKLGEEASGPHAELKIVDIPDGIEYEISDYDGVEEIHEAHRKWS